MFTGKRNPRPVKAGGKLYIFYAEPDPNEDDFVHLEFESLPCSTSANALLIAAEWMDDNWETLEQQDKEGARQVQLLLSEGSYADALTNWNTVMDAWCTVRIAECELDAGVPRKLTVRPPPPTQDEIDEGIVIYQTADTWEARQGSKVVATSKSRRGIFRELHNTHCGSIYSITDHGNVTEWDCNGKKVCSWV